jgi:hypothetical protein
MKSPFVLAAVLVLLAIAVLVGMFFFPTPSETDRPVAVAPAATATGAKDRTTYATLENTVSASSDAGAKPAQVPVAPPPPLATEESLTAKGQDLDRVHDAMVTYSEEGLPVLKAYLTNSDPEVRLAAIEAIEQLAVPSGAEVLQAAAKNAKTAEEAKEMLAAAEFLKLPRLPISELKRLIKEGKIAPASDRSGQTAAPQSGSP